MKVSKHGKNPFTKVLVPSAWVAVLLMWVQVPEARSQCQITNTVKFYMTPNIANGTDVMASHRVALADDFFCNSKGPITDIHIWGSWLTNNVGLVTNFWLGIYNDVPAGTNPTTGLIVPSHPGTNLLWSQTFGQGDYTYGPTTNTGNECFYNPSNNVVLGSDTQPYFYCFYPTNPFVQQGTPQQPTNYWLAVSAQLYDPNNTWFGWKTCISNYNDGAVWIAALGGRPVPGATWAPITNFCQSAAPYPVDLAFVITTTNSPPSNVCAETNGTKYVQWPNLFGGLDVWDSSSRPSQVTDGPWWLADDFVCTQTGPITDIHLWGSWQNDAPLLNSITFQLYVLDDVPANPLSNPYSHPGTNVVWHQTFPPGSYDEVPATNGSEYFFDPGIPEILGGDTLVWYYCFYPTNLIQYGAPGQATNYWLAALAELPAGTTNVFGWKSTTNVQNDISVHGPWPGPGLPPIGLPWKPNYESSGNQQPFDLAFKLTTATNCIVSVVCPVDKTNQCGAAWTFDPPSVSDSCCTNPLSKLTSSNLVNSTTCSQLYQGIWTVYDCAGATVLGVCTQYVTILDTNAPIFIGCVPSKTVQCGSAWTFDTPTANYLCSGSNAVVGIISTTTNGGGCRTLATQVWGATNQCSGAFATCTEVVTITETNPPSITCPPSIVTNSCTPVVVTWSITASDPCGVVGVGSSPPSGTAFPIGTTTVTATATNVCGLTNSCSFTVTVQCPQTNCCPEVAANKWVQWPDLVTPGIDINASQGFNLADDFGCDTMGPITDIRIWGSWLSDMIDPNATYVLSIYSDVPKGAPNNPFPYSHPGTNLWQQTFGPGQYGMCLYTNIGEQFFTPTLSSPTVLNLLGGSTNLYYLCFKPDPTNTFVQMGTPAAHTNYWLSVYVLTSAGTQLEFGWKTSATNYGDSAVWGSGIAPPPVGWTPMTDPRPGQTNPVNMAFKINTTPICCAETNGVKYVQWPDTNQTGVDVWDSSSIPPGVPAGDGPWVLADDFVCTNTGPISDIHLWGSWWYDFVATNQITFWIGLFDDVPTNSANPYSHPGKLLWQQCFPPGQYCESLWGNGQETFMDPGPPSNIGSDSEIWYYCFNPSNAPRQFGTLTNKQIYWLAAYAILPPTYQGNDFFGWKSTTNIHHDVSVHTQFPATGPNCPDFPLGAPLAGWTPTTTPDGRPLDLAFKLTTSTNCMVSINCPVPTKTNQCGAAWSFDPPSVIDTCCATPGLTLVSNLISSTACSQVYQGIWTVTDCGGAVIGVCTQYVTLLDTNAPVFNGCVASKPVQCGTVWSFDTPTANYLCSGSNAMVGVVTTFTNVATACSNVVTQVWGTTNQCNGAYATCAEVVTITDTNPPTIVCPSNIVVYTCDTNPVVVRWPTNVATATCGIATVTSMPPPGSAFLPDTTNTVVLIARNACGFTNSCSFTVAVRRPVLGPIGVTLIPTNRVVLTWTYGILQSTTNLLVPFSDVTGATSPYTNSTVPPPVARFYRLRCNSP